MISVIIKLAFPTIMASQYASRIAAVTNSNIMPAYLLQVIVGSYESQKFRIRLL